MRNHPGGRTRTAADAALVERYQRAVAASQEVAAAKLRVEMRRRGVDLRGRRRIARECPACLKLRAPLDFPRIRARATGRRLDLGDLPRGACLTCRRKQQRVLAGTSLGYPWGWPSPAEQ